jgi:hypothetical protein
MSKTNVHKFHYYIVLDFSDYIVKTKNNGCKLFLYYVYEFLKSIFHLFIDRVIM